jgi:RecB family exonuclease
LISVSMMEARRRGAINCGEAWWGCDSGRPARGRGGSDGWGLLGSDVRERKRVDGLHKLKEEAPFGKYAKAAQAEWAERAHDGLRGEAGRGCSGLGRMGRNRRKTYFRIKYEFSNIQRL